MSCIYNSSTSRRLALRRAWPASNSHAKAARRAAGIVSVASHEPAARRAAGIVSVTSHELAARRAARIVVCRSPPTRASGSGSVMHIQFFNLYEVGKNIYPTGSQFITLQEDYAAIPTSCPWRQS